MKSLFGKVISPQKSTREKTKSSRPDRDVEVLDLQLKLLQAKNTSLGINLQSTVDRLEQKKANAGQDISKVLAMEQELEEVLTTKENESNQYCGSAEYERQKTILRLQIAELTEEQETQQLEILQLKESIGQREMVVHRFNQVRRQHEEALEQLQLDMEASLPMDHFADNQMKILETQLKTREASLEKQRLAFQKQIQSKLAKLAEIESRVEQMYGGIQELQVIRFGASQPAKGLSMKKADLMLTQKSEPAAPKPVSILKQSGRDWSQNARQSLLVAPKVQQAPPLELKRRIIPEDLKPQRGRPIFQGKLKKKSARPFKTWTTKYAVLYRCDQCYQLRLADSEKMKKAEVYNIVANISHLISLDMGGGPDQPKAFELRIDPCDSKAPVLLLAAGSEYGQWWNMLQDAVTNNEISTTTSLDVSLQANSSDSMALDLENQLSI